MSDRNPGFQENLVWAARQVLPYAAYGIVVVTLASLLGGHQLRLFGGSYLTMVSAYLGTAAIVIVLMALLRPGDWTWGSAIGAGVLIGPAVAFFVFRLVFTRMALWDVTWISLLVGVMLGVIYGAMCYYFWVARFQGRSGR